MGILTDDMKRVVSEQKLGFCATGCPDGSPNALRKAARTPRPLIARCHPASRYFPTGFVTREAAWTRGRREKRMAPSSILPYLRVITSRA